MAMCPRGFAVCLLLVVLLSSLTIEAEAKKRRKQSRRHSAPSPAARTPRAASASAAVAATAAAAAAAAATAAGARAEAAELATITASRRCNADKAVLAEANKEAVAKYSKLVSEYNTLHQSYSDLANLKHNKLVSEYNTLLKSHADLIKKFNGIVVELEDPSLANFVAAKAIKAYHHPGIQGAVNKTFVHILPKAQPALINFKIKSDVVINESITTVENFLQSYGGDQEWVPSMSGFIVYASLLIPIGVAFWCVLEFVCKLHQLLLLGHVYLSVFAVCLSGFACYTGEDPLSTFAEQDSTLYQFAQCAFAFVFLIYGLISAAALCFTDRNPTLRGIHMGVVLLFGAMYYIMIWTPAMTDEYPMIEDMVESLVKPEMPGKAPEPPRVFVTAPYAVVALVFFALFMGESHLSKVSVRDSDEEKAQ